MMAETGNHYRYGNGNMAEQTTTWPLSNHSDTQTNISDHKSFYLFSFSHYILNDVDTSNCKAMISMNKATCFFLTQQEVPRKGISNLESPEDKDYGEVGSSLS
jgi:hypothetical protein